jgi:hypothetical protein
MESKNKPGTLKKIIHPLENLLESLRKRFSFHYKPLSKPFMQITKKFDITREVPFKEQPVMNIKSIVLMLALSVSSLFANDLLAQSGSEDDTRIGNMLAVTRKEQVIAQKLRNEERTTSAEVQNKEIKANTKEDLRIERDASKAARDSKIALQSKKRAERLRTRADHRIAKNVKERDKSGTN